MNSAADFILTTVIEFSDRAEGQVMHRGMHDECRKLIRMMPAIAISCPDVPTSCRYLIVPAAELDMQAGQRWACKRGDEA